jgi:hypothetical protein
MEHTKVIAGRVVRIGIGSVIRPDGWSNAQTLLASEWNGAPFRLPSARYLDVAYAVDVKITGRSYQFRRGAHQSLYGDFWVRVVITWLTDEEPFVRAADRGWLLVEPYKLEVAEPAKGIAS